MENTRVPKRSTHQGESPKSATSPSHAAKPAPLAAPADPGQGADMSVDLRTLPIFPPERKNATGMPDTLKTGVETLSGFSMDKVRVHYRSPHPARVRARAYTQGTDIHIGPGQEKHLPHEAWHVVQQMQGRVKPTTQMGAAILNDDEALEQEAEREGKRASSLAPLLVPPLRPSSSPGAFPRQGQQITEPPSAVQLSGKPVLQRMPFNQIRAGRYYRVRVLGEIKVLFLLNKLDKEKTGTGRAAFYFSNNGASSEVTEKLVGEENILDEVAAPTRNKETGIEEESESADEKSEPSFDWNKFLGDEIEEESESAESEYRPEEHEASDEESEASDEEEKRESLEEGADVDPRVLGAASWNVAHFSGHDIARMLEQLQSQLKKFSEAGEAWKQLAPALKALLQAIKDDPEMKQSLKPREKSYVDVALSDEEDSDDEGSRDEYHDEGSDDESEEERSSKKRRASSKKKGQSGKKQAGKKRKASAKKKGRSGKKQTSKKRKAARDDKSEEEPLKKKQKASRVDKGSRKKQASKKRKAARDDESEEEPLKKKQKASRVDKGPSGKQQASKKRKAARDDESEEEPPDKKQKIAPDVSQRRRSARVSKPVERLNLGTKTSLKRVQDPQARLKKLTDLITSQETEPEQFNIAGFIDEMNKLAAFNWDEEYNQADSPEKRKLFARKVKDLRKNVDAIGKAKKAYKKFLELRKEKKLLAQLGKPVKKQAAAFFSLLDKVKDTLPKKTTFDKAASALHSPNIVTHIDEMFKKNKSWLDIMLLQEVNNPGLLEKGEHPYEVRRGPHLMSGGKKPQNEYYPLLIRKGSGISVRTVYVVETDGKMKKVNHDQEQKWNKNPAPGEEATYRPIVVYDIVKESKKGVQRYWVGIVHTTPESDSSGVAEFNRRAIYQELARGLKTLKEKAASKKIPLIIGGDYYLSAEAVVENLTPEQKAQSQIEGTEEKEDYDKSKEAIEKLIAKIDRELKALGEEEKEPEAPVKEPGAKKKKKTKSSGKKGKARKAKPKEFIRDDLTLPGEELGGEEEAETDPQRILLRKIRLVLKEASKDEQILRNIYQLTVAGQIKKLGLYLAQTVSGTNPKKDPLENWYYLQIADFFVHNEQLKSFTTGIMHPEGGILSVDTEGPQGSAKDLQYSKYWQHFSDHFPVGAVYSLDEGDLSSHPAMVGSGSQKAKELAKTSNINRFARLYLKQNDLTGVSDKERENAALAYLKKRLPEATDIEAEPSEKAPETVEDYIKKIQAHEEEHNIPPAKRLFVTLPGDFEPDLGPDDDQSSSSQEEKPSPGTPGSKGDEDKQGKEPSGSQPKDPAGAQGKGPGSNTQQGSGSTTQQGSGATGEKSQKKDSESKGEEKGAEGAPQGPGSQTGQRTINVGDLVLLEYVRKEWTVVRVTSVKPGGKADVELPALRSMLRWRDEPVSELPPAPADKQLGDKFPKQ